MFWDGSARISELRLRLIKAGGVSDERGAVSPCVVYENWTYCTEDERVQKVLIVA